MQKNITQGISGYLERARQRRIWLKVVSALGCVVVFCTTYALILPAVTMEQPMAYMQSLTVQKIADGSAPFDALETDGVDLPGNDSDDSNRIVRTFDSIVYTLQVVSASRDPEKQMDEYVAVVEAELDLDITQARFDAESLSSIFAGDDSWQIEYKDKDNSIRYIETAAGLYQCDSDGKITDTKASINAMANGSSGESPYRTGISSQHLVAYRRIVSTNDQKAVPSTQTVTVQVNVQAAKNGDKIQPRFEAYVKGNKSNLGSKIEEDEESGLPAVITPDAVSVSAAARYNVAIQQNKDSSYSSYFNFSTGTETTSDDKNGVYGRNLNFGITLELFNETNVKKADGSVDGAVLTEKGLRGVELPIEDITFQMTLEGKDSSGRDVNGDYSLILWDYALNYEKNEPGQWGRNRFWKNQTASLFPKGASVYSSGNRINSAYDSGTWQITASSPSHGDLDDQGHTTGSITNTGSQVTYNVTVHGFDFDFDNFTFPTQSCGNAGDVFWLEPGYIGAFSAGQIQVIQKYPTTQETDATPEFTVTVSGLAALSMSKQKAETEAAAISETVGGTVDNKATGNTVLYTPGGLSKHNSFGSRLMGHGSISSGFLGTNYWQGPHFDAYAFAGDSIYLWGAAQLSRNSDAVVSAYNLLQKFDSKALSIDTSEKPQARYTECNLDSNWPAEGWSGGNREGNLLPAAGRATFLYAADPKYPSGWDSNIPEQMKRMNAATEEDLLYFESLEKLESAGFTCCAILLEVRDAEIPAGCYPGMRVAMKVTEDRSSINKTIATVNTVRMWVKGPACTVNLLDDVSWINGSMNSITADTVDQFTTNKIVDKEQNDIYSTLWDHDNVSAKTVINNLRTKYPNEATVSYLTHSSLNNYNYVKTEYKNGIKVDGTHQGYQEGMSLLIIGYESSVDIQVQNTRSGISSDTVGAGNVRFEPGQSDWNPLYTITNISTKANSPNGGTASATVTNLTITASMLAETNLLSMSAAPFTIFSNGQTVTVSENANSPTVVTFTGSDGVEHNYQIWAERVGESQAVFHLLGVPVGIELPDIQFEGQLGTGIAHNGNYTAQVTIQGDEDIRSLSSGNRNIAPVSVTAILLNGTTLTKTVDHSLIEQNGTFTYSISYTNNSTDATLERMFLYDLLPYDGDNRGSSFDGSFQVQEMSVALSGVGAAASSNTAVFQYYSTASAEILKPVLDFVTAGDSTSSDDIKNLLSCVLIGDDNNLYVVGSADKPVSVYTYDGSLVTGVASGFHVDDNGKITIPDGQSVSKIDGTTGSATSYYKLFRWLGSTTGGGALSGGIDCAGLSNATCLYSVVENLGTATTLTIISTLKTSGNEAADVYGNTAHSWKEGDVRSKASLTSNRVTTRVVGRTISGLIWEDMDCDGKQTTAVTGKPEPLISGVTCTLFKWNDTIQKYEQVMGGDGPYGRQIMVTYQNADNEFVTEKIQENNQVLLVTGPDGTYQFSNLSDGRYVVAFSGDALKRFALKGATKYQVNGVNDSSTNDGVVNNNAYPGINSDEYPYCIQYGSDNQQAVYLHTLDEMQENSALLRNSVELIEHQDLGLCIVRHELPQTGGSGTTLYTMGGLLILIGAGFLLLYKSRRSQKGGLPSEVRLRRK